MRTQGIFSLISLVALAAANYVKFDAGVNSQVCAGLYSKHDWGGSLTPRVQMTLEKYGKDKYKEGSDQETTESVSLSYVVFEYRDIDSIGILLSDNSIAYICDDSLISQGICTKEHRNKFLTNDRTPNSTIFTSEMTQLGPARLDYVVNNTGYYCVATYSEANYGGQINFQNAFGHLAASEIPKLPAYGILTICYVIALALFGFQFFKKRKENQILPLQRYLLAMIGFLTFDTIVVWSYYDLVNRTKNSSSAFVTFYMSFLSILNAIKITVSFFLLLCIGLGYGVVKLKLPKKIMLRCKILAGAHFAATMLYLFSSYYTDNNSSISSSSSIGEDELGGLLGIIPMIPVTITLCIYYVAILVSIRTTTRNLHQQRQIIKLKLYENLFKVIFASVVLTIAGFTLSSFIFIGMSSTQIIEEHWKAAYFLYDFWPSVIFFFVFMGIAWLWRPTETSYMLAVSQQLSGGENVNEDGTEVPGAGYHQGHEFELDDLSLMSHSDHEHENGHSRDADSFELRDTSTDQAAPPPQYEELDKKVKKEHEHNPDEGASTLFEVGEGEESDDDRTDDRLR